MGKQQIVNPAMRPTPLPLSSGIVAGSTIYLSGMVGTDPATGQLAGDDIQSQTRQILENARVLLKQVGLDMDSVVKTTVFLTNIEDSKGMNDVYKEFFSAPYPARSTVGISALARSSFLVEIELIAVKS